MAKLLSIPLSLSVLVLLTACTGDDAPPVADAGTDDSAPMAMLELESAHPAPFSYLSGVRELPDGRLFAADPLSQLFLRVDLAAGTADTLGGQGEGPGEYQGPDHVLPLPADSTLLVDLGNSRLIVVSPEGEFVDWIPMFRAREDGTARTIRPYFSDDSGLLYLPAHYALEGTPPDSSGISRFDRATNSEAVVAWAWHPERPPFDPNAKRPIFRPMDDWAAGPDGRIAVVRANGFSVDWHLTDGEILRGPSNSVESYAFGEAEKEAEMEQMARDAIFTTTRVGEGGVQSQQMTRGLPPGAAPGVDAFEWPETLPLFRPNKTRVSPEGEVWVRRMMPVSMSPRYDIFDEAGVRRGFVELPEGGEVIGFGMLPSTRGMVYVARVDEVGLIWLERYRLLPS